MRHSHHIFPYEPWMIALFIAGLIASVILLIWFIHRRTVASDGLTGKERKELSSEQREILSMLRQYGSSMMQTELVDIMPYDLDDIAGILKEMESKGLIRREWKSEQGTYEITAAS
jgi:DNA-binding MarR family transcriptional regulator